VALLDSPINQNLSQEGRSHAETSSFDGNTSVTVSLRSINAVAAHVQFIEEARTTVTNEMENMVMTGLATLVRNLFFNLIC
jgi:conserved oligomeric Golgi complex subunit 5